MKAFTLYPPEVTHYRKLLTKLQDYGVANFDDMETFIDLYAEWHIKIFLVFLLKRQQYFKENLGL